MLRAGGSQIVVAVSENDTRLSRLFLCSNSGDSVLVDAINGVGFVVACWP